MKKTTKIGIIGAGHVGSHVASSLMTQGLCDEIVLLDTDEGKARRHADDIADSVAYMPLPAKIYAGGYEALADADIVVLSACSTIFEQDRLLELDATVKVIAEIAPQLTASGFSGIVVSISNPCDVIAQYFARITGLNVVGTGTALDSARLRRRLAAMLGVSPHSVCAYELGEHGDSQIAAFSAATVCGKLRTGWRSSRTPAARRICTEPGALPWRPAGTSCRARAAQNLALVRRLRRSSKPFCTMKRPCFPVPRCWTDLTASTACTPAFPVFWALRVWKRSSN